MRLDDDAPPSQSEFIKEWLSVFKVLCVSTCGIAVILFSLFILDTVM